jgi:hypothetical protein
LASAETFLTTCTGNPLWAIGTGRYGALQS